MTTSGSPNVVVVVLDCVRGSALADAGGLLDALPHLRELRRESVAFPRCASVSHWTVPSHASLLTGVYPWEHGLYRGGRPTLPPEVPRLPRALRRAGYRTGSFCANGLLRPEPGWLEGFEYAGWGCSAYLRSSRSDRPPAQSTAPGPGPGRSPRERGSRASYFAVVALERFPWALDRIARLEHRLRGDPTRSRPALAPWIEPTFERWLAATPDDTPAFAFLNLMDAHEPYLIDREDGLSAEVRAAAARVRQDHHGWISGRWAPDARESDLLELLYRGAIRTLDERIGRIVAALRATGRWEETLLVLTSDHGQSFGRDGGLYHMTGLSEELLRIPLWVRWPGAARGGSTGRGWASPIDVAATALEASRADRSGLGDAIPLDRLLADDRPGPVLALGDGPTFGDAARHLGPAAWRRSDPRAVAGYLGPWKAVRRADEDHPRFFAIESDPREERPLDPPEGAAAGLLREQVDRVVERLAAAPASAPAPGVERLRAWGYVD